LCQVPSLNIEGLHQFGGTGQTPLAGDANAVWPPRPQLAKPPMYGMASPVASSASSSESTQSWGGPERGLSRSSTSVSAENLVGDKWSGHRGASSGGGGGAGSGGGGGRPPRGAASRGGQGGDPNSARRSGALDEIDWGAPQVWLTPLSHRSPVVPWSFFRTTVPASISSRALVPETDLSTEAILFVCTCSPYQRGNRLRFGRHSSAGD
jgi:hypothetical protein